MTGQSRFGPWKIKGGKTNFECPDRHYEIAEYTGCWKLTKSYADITACLLENCTVIDRLAEIEADKGVGKVIKIKKEIPADCYACWLCDEHDYTDGFYCKLLSRRIMWYMNRRRKPMDCPLI